MNISEQLKASQDQYSTICISTAHVSKEDRTKLSRMCFDPNCNMIMKRDTGWFVKLYDEAEDNDYDVSEDLKALFYYCVEAGFRMIEFDCDAEIYGFFTRYE